MKNKSCPTKRLFDKIQSTDYNYHKNYWIYLVSALALILVGLIMFAVLSFNFTFSFTGGKIVNIEYGYTMSDDGYTQNEQTVKEILDKHNIKNYEIRKTGEKGDYATLVQIIDTKQKPVNETALNEAIEEIKTTFTREQGSFEVTLTTSRAFAGDKVMTDFAIVFSILLVLAFVYMWIRYSFTATLAGFIGLIFSIAMMASFTVITRVPTSEYFVAVMLATLILTIIYSVYIFGNINQLLMMQEYDSKTNNDIMNAVRKKGTLLNMITSCFVFVVVVMLLIFGTNTIRFLSLQLLFGLIASLYVNMTIIPAIWVKLYNRKKDKHLQARQKKLQQKQTKNQEETK